MISFLTITRNGDGDIITNPPFKYATEFVRKALDIIPERKQGCNVLENSVP